MNKIFTSYKQAFDNFDAKEIASHYKFPCQISDVDGLQIFETSEQLTVKFLKNCENMKSMGYSGSVFDIIELKSLGENIVSVDINWTVFLGAGDYEFKTYYLCQREVDEFLIFNAVVY